MSFQFISNLGNPDEKIRDDMNLLYSSLCPDDKNEYLYYDAYNYNEEMLAYAIIYDDNNRPISMAHACAIIQNDEYFVVFIKFATHELFRNNRFGQKCVKQVIFNLQTLKPEPWILFIYNEDNNILKRISENLGFKNTVIFGEQPIDMELYGAGCKQYITYHPKSNGKELLNKENLHIEMSEDNESISKS